MISIYGAFQLHFKKTMQNFEFVKILRDTISHRRNPLSEDLSLPESEQDLLYENAAIVFVCSEYAGLLM